MTQEQERTITVAGSVLTIAASVAQLAATNSNALTSLMGPGTWLLAGTAGWALVRGRRKHQAAVEPAGMKTAFVWVAAKALCLLMIFFTCAMWLNRLLAVLNIGTAAWYGVQGDQARAWQILWMGVGAWVAALIFHLLNQFLQVMAATFIAEEEA